MNVSSMTALACIIAVADYPQYPLKNPINDGKAIAEVLKRLGFIVKLTLNPGIEQFDIVVKEFGSEVGKYDVGLLYYAGHGMQIEGVNYLSATNTPFTDEIMMKHRSISLDMILDYMDKAENKTSIVILDACRNNPYARQWQRNIASAQLAPVYAPKGTLVAFSTSPRETASDGVGDYSPYALSILQHIETRRISVEEFFKRVRNSVFAITGGRQTSWEHTSLSGGFEFNSGKLTHVIESPYNESAIADGRYEYNPDNGVDSIIKELKTYNYDTQNLGIVSVKKLDLSGASSDQLFVIGRSILSAANDNAYKANNFMNGLEHRVDWFQQEGENHVLNGMLFEVYFNSKGQLRAEKFRTKYLRQLLQLRNLTEYQKSFEFIERQLDLFREELFYIPGPNEHSISFNIEHEVVEVNNDHQSRDPGAKQRINILAVKWERRDVLVIKKDPWYEYGDGSIAYEQYSIRGLRAKIAEEIAIPEDMLTLSFNVGFDDSVIVHYPFSGLLRKNNVSE